MDYYKTLGVSREATDDEIRKAYRKLARQYHPDKNPGDKASEDKFKEIGEAYETLKDPKKRRAYNSGGSGGFGGFNPGNFGGGFGGGAQPFDLSDLLGGEFSDLFGPARTKAPSHGRHIQTNVSLTFDDAFSGTKVTIPVDRARTGEAPKVVRLHVKIPAGIKDGATMRLRGKGEPGVSGAPAGDLLLKIAVAKNDTFTRQGDDFIVMVPITLAEAALGEKVKIPVPEGGKVQVKVPAGSNDGKTLRIRGRGPYLANGKRGDLLARVHIAVPEKLTAEQREALKAYQRATEKSRGQ